ncbi:MAG: 6-phospho-beta-glucosidase [Anaerolineae bacterium]|nr:6-phospho-beta-glucosidase [Anaerolineae bacterium]
MGISSGTIKIAVIGGGSTYTPELVSGLIASAGRLGLRELWLMDVDPQRLEVVGGFARRLVAASGEPFLLQTTTDRAAALAGASFVVTQVRVGGMAARHEDELLGRRWGLVGQETTGVGGFAKALRTIPVILSVARDMQRLCPEAWLINFANPSGLVTEALHRYLPGVHAIGLCNAPIGMQMAVAGQLGVEPRAVQLQWLGLNHLTWATGATVSGRDVWPQLLSAYLERLRADEDPVCPPYLVELLRAIPSGYLRYYYRTAAVVAHQATHPTRAEEVMRIEADLLAQYADPRLSALPDELMLRGGAYYSTAAVQLMDSLQSDAGDVHVLDVRHGGAVPGWPADWVCELPCRVDASGPHPLPAFPLPVLADGLVHAVKAYELLAAEAAVTGDRRAALQALVAHPLGPGAERAPQLLEDLLRVNARHLPQFGGGGAS